MFGTLNCSIQRTEPLKFVEMPDPTAALNRAQKDKPHLSCETCRRRKVRCDGNPSGCDKCKAGSAECQYPERDTRRKRRTTSPSASGYGNGFGSRSSRSSGSKSKSQGSDMERRFSTRSDVQTQPEIRSPPSELGTISDIEFDHEFDQEQMQCWLLSSSDEDGLFNKSDCDFSNSSKVQEQLQTVFHNSDRLEDDQSRTLVDMSDLNFLSFDDFDTNAYQNMPISNGSALPDDIAVFGDIPSAYSEPSPASGQHFGRSHRSTRTSNSDCSMQSIQSSNMFTIAQMDSTVSATPPNTALTPLMADSGEDSGPSCHCLQVTARLLEDLGACRANQEPLLVDVLLSTLRKALAQSSATLRCKFCTSQSASHILLAMAGQYMSAICERIVDFYLQSRQAAKTQPRTDFTGTGVQSGSTVASSRSSSATSLDDMNLRSYRIETRWERVQVLRCLVMVQLAELSRTLDVLKIRAGPRVGHLAPLVEAMNQVQVLRKKVEGKSSR